MVAWEATALPLGDTRGRAVYLGVFSLLTTICGDDLGCDPKAVFRRLLPIGRCFFPANGILSYLEAFVLFAMQTEGFDLPSTSDLTQIFMPLPKLVKTAVPENVVQF